MEGEGLGGGWRVAPAGFLARGRGGEGRGDKWGLEGSGRRGRLRGYEGLLEEWTRIWRGSQEHGGAAGQTDGT